MTWISVNDALVLTHDWQLLPVRAESIYRFSVVSGDFGVSGIGRYEVGQFDLDGSNFNFRLYRTETTKKVVVCEQPAFFAEQCIGLRVPIGFELFTIKVEVNDMPLTNAPEGAPGADSVSATTVPSSTTAAQLIAANPNRKMLTIQNVSTATLFIDLDGAVTNTSYYTRLLGNAYYEFPINYRGAVHGVWSGANGNAEIREYI
jgi:hypothetical protein